MISRGFLGSSIFLAAACLPLAFAGRPPLPSSKQQQRVLVARQHHQALLLLQQRGGQLEETTENRNGPIPADVSSLLASSLVDDSESLTTATEPVRGGSTPPVSPPPKEGGRWQRNDNSNTAKNNKALNRKRGGTNSTEPTTAIKILGIPQQKFVAGSAALVVTSALAYRYREALRPLLDKHYIQEHALTNLRKLEQQPFSLAIYMVAMAVWEILGLSTIPVETAAGMVFGFPRGVLASGTGKMMGAFGAFWMGRSLLSQWVRTKLSQNPVWSTLDKSTQVHSPLMVALLMKFSCFPEFIKNFGSSCLDMPFAAFVVASCVHGLTYTALWTFLGVDAAKRLEDPTVPANIALQVTLFVAALVGLVGSPVLMAWWIRDMTKRNAAAIDSNEPTK